MTDDMREDKRRCLADSVPGMWVYRTRVPSWQVCCIGATVLLTILATVLAATCLPGIPKPLWALFAALLLTTLTMAISEAEFHFSREKPMPLNVYTIQVFNAKQLVGSREIITDSPSAAIEAARVYYDANCSFKVVCHRPFYDLEAPLPGARD